MTRKQKLTHVAQLRLPKGPRSARNRKARRMGLALVHLWTLEMDGVLECMARHVRLAWPAETTISTEQTT